MAAGDMCTAAEIQTFAGINATTYASELAAIITAVSAWVKKYCGRDFIAANYREMIDGNGRREIHLTQYPIIDIRFISDDTTNAMQVRYTGSANVATVEVEDRTSLKLKRQSGGAETTDATLAFSTYTTLTTLVAAVNNTTDWSATRLTTDQDQQDTFRLLPFEGGNARGVWLTIETESDPETDYHVNDVTGEITRDFSVWTKGKRNYVAWYSAGYGTVGSATSADLPADLRMIVWRLVAHAFHNRTHNAGMKSEKLGDYSYTRGNTDNLFMYSGYPTELIADLDMWKRPWL